MSRGHAFRDHARSRAGGSTPMHMHPNAETHALVGDSLMLMRASSPVLFPCAPASLPPIQKMAAACTFVASKLEECHKWVGSGRGVRKCGGRGGGVECKRGISRWGGRGCRSAGSGSGKVRKGMREGCTQVAGDAQARGEGRPYWPAYLRAYPGCRLPPGYAMPLPPQEGGCVMLPSSEGGRGH